MADPINKHPLAGLVNFFETVLLEDGFSGEFHCDKATCLVNATDNSIYEVVPQAVAMPKNRQDVEKLIRLANQEAFSSLYFCARGGGTGTNGQSLSDGVVIDFSRFMNKIREFNPEQKTIIVEPGVILSELNRFLQPHGLFFAPNVSTADRATIGGMIATDAAGKGSLIYGKTADHLLGLEMVLADGRVIDALEDNKLPEPLNDFLCDTLAKPEVQAEIATRFPNLKRPLSGYNLKQAYQNSICDLNYLVAGSEGTLGLVTAAKLKLVEIPKQRALIAVHYPDFISALKDAENLIRFKPLAIEVLDEKVQQAAHSLAEWQSTADILQAKPENIISNFAEFCAVSVAELEAQLAAVTTELERQAANYVVIRDNQQINRMWAIRSLAVGLVGRLPGKRKPMAFVEDAIVPPENLAAFVGELQQELDSRQLVYAMYGHVDVGCIHVRPALDMLTETDRQLIRPLTESVVALVKKYGGVLWGEHGKGYRGEFVPAVFGDKLYAVLVEIKKYFDPQNRFNRLKLVAPDISIELAKIDKITMRGELDQVISSDLQEQFADALLCNGNGACFNQDAANVMCPSYKVTQDRIHSPKGRALLIKEWLRQKSTGSNDEQKAAAMAYAALSGCLGCKACSGKCPTQVSIPDLRSKFLHSYHKLYRKRKLRDLMLGHIESLLPLAAKFPKMWNFIHRNRLAPSFGLTSIPLFETDQTLAEGLHQLQVKIYSDPKQLPALPDNSVAIFTDVFSAFLDNKVLFSTVAVLQKLGKVPYVIYPRVSGKSLVFGGFLDEFKRNSAKLARLINPLLRAKIPVITVENSITVMFRDEMKKFACALDGKVLTIAELLAQYNQELSNCERLSHESGKYRLLPHCTEQALLPADSKHWQNIFAASGATLEVVNGGCCGMAGTYGHLKEQQQNSAALFKKHWQNNIETSPVTVVASGFSCRSQTKKQIGQVLPHPIEIINNLIK